MPIKGLSERRQLPRAGKIHLGIKKQNKQGNEYPSATDYFVVNADHSTSPEAAQAFRHVYGYTPRALDILFPNIGTDLEGVKNVLFPQYYKQYGRGTGLKCKGDGVRATRVITDDATGEVRRQEIQCPGPESCQYVKKMSDGSGGFKYDCGPLATLQILLPKVDLLGVWHIDTSSINSIVQVNSDMELIYRAAGRLGNIPLKLKLIPREVSPNGNKKIVYILTVLYTGSMKRIAKIGTMKVNPNMLVDISEIDDSEIPEYHRPPGLLPDDHPLRPHLPGVAAPAQGDGPTMGKNTAGEPVKASDTTTPSHPLPASPQAHPASSTAPVGNPPAGAPPTDQKADHRERRPPPEVVNDEQDPVEALESMGEPWPNEPTTVEPETGPVHRTEDNIRFHLNRLAVGQRAEVQLRRTYKTPERLLEALEKVPSPRKPYRPSEDAE